jgi:hypothetical protein
MPRLLRRSWALSAVTLCAVLAGPIAGAQASNATIRAAVNTFNAKLLHDEARVLDGLGTYQSKHNATPLISALNHEVTDLHALQVKLAHQSASSVSGRKGKSDIDTGLGLIAKAYKALAVDVKASTTAPVSAAKVNAAVKTDKKGRADLTAGAKLLG